MSGMYVQRGSPSGFSGWSITDLPIIGNIIGAADDKVRDAVEYITKKYAEYAQAQRQAPEILADAERFFTVMTESGSDEQRVLAARYLAAARETMRGAENSGPVEQVVQWLAQAKSTMGMGVVAVPLWIAGVAVVALGIVKMTVSSWSEGRTVRAALAAGLSPEQIAKLGVGRSPFGTAMFGATSAITALVALGGVWLVYSMLKGR